VRRPLPGFIVFAALCLAATPAHAQSSIDPPLVEFSVSPGGAIFFTKNKAEPDFGSYGLDGAITVNLTRFVGVGGEIGGSFGTSQQLDFGARSGLEQKTPNLLDYSGNLMFSARSGSSVVPYVTLLKPRADGETYGSKQSCEMRADVRGLTLAVAMLLGCCVVPAAAALALHAQLAAT
jgi:hypothetical protein